MTTSDMVRELCEKKNISLAELCRRIGQTPQHFNKKLKRNTVSYDEMMVIVGEQKNKLKPIFLGHEKGENKLLEKRGHLQEQFCKKNSMIAYRNNIEYSISRDIKEENKYG